MIPSGINLIGIHGKAGSGKDTLARYFHTFYENIYIEHFADPLKDAASHAFGIPREDFDDPESKEAHNLYWNTSPRKIAQFFGTELFREAIQPLLGCGPNFWIQRMEGKLTGQLLLDGEGEYEEGDTIIIPDVRFQNEVDWITENGGSIIHIVRPSTDTQSVGIPNHQSEQPVEMKGAWYKVDNHSDFPNLFFAAESALKHFGITLAKK